MDQFTRGDLRNLIQSRHEACVSMYMPMHRTGRDTRENHIHLKNGAATAEEKLLELGVKSTLARAILEPVRKLASDNGFLQRQAAGLALFAAPDEFHVFRAPLNFPEKVIVADQYHVRPMLRLLQGDGNFYLLAVSQNNVRLFRGSHYSIAELEPATMPKSLQDALNIDEYKESIQHLAYSAVGIGAGPGGMSGKVSAGKSVPGQGTVGGGSGSPMVTRMHGHGGSNMDVKKSDEIREFFVRLNNGLQEFFREEHDPLVFAGVEYLFPIFKHVCHYRSLLDAPVRGNPDGLSADELHRKAWEVVEPHFHEAEEKALQRFGDGLGGDMVSTDLEEVLQAARNGRIDMLLIDSEKEVWGQVDGDSGKIVQRDEPGRTGAVDLIDHAVADTLLTGGTVFAVDPQRLPNGAPVGAIFRYRAHEAGGEPRATEKSV